MTRKQFKACIEYLRARVKGKRFDDDPEAFKDIESLKVKMWKVYPDDERPRPVA